MELIITISPKEKNINGKIQGKHAIIIKYDYVIKWIKLSHKCFRRV